MLLLPDPLTLPPPPPQLIYWLASRPEPQAIVNQAHDKEVWALAWHPVGHLLASGRGAQRGAGGGLMGQRERGASGGGGEGEEEEEELEGRGAATWALTLKPYSPVGPNSETLLPCGP